MPAACSSGGLPPVTIMLAPFQFDRFETSARTCSGFGTNIGAAFSGKAKAAAKKVAVRTDKSFFIITEPQSSSSS